MTPDYCLTTILEIRKKAGSHCGAMAPGFFLICRNSSQTVVTAAGLQTSVRKVLLDTGTRCEYTDIEKFTTQIFFEMGEFYYGK